MTINLQLPNFNSIFSGNSFSNFSAKVSSIFRFPNNFFYQPIATENHDDSNSNFFDSFDLIEKLQELSNQPPVSIRLDIENFSEPDQGELSELIQEETQLVEKLGQLKFDEVTSPGIITAKIIKEIDLYTRELKPNQFQAKKEFIYELDNIVALIKQGKISDVENFSYFAYKKNRFIKQFQELIRNGQPSSDTIFSINTYKFNGEIIYEDQVEEIYKQILAHFQKTYDKSDLAQAKAILFLQDMQNGSTATTIIAKHHSHFTNISENISLSCHTSNTTRNIELKENTLKLEITYITEVVDSTTFEKRNKTNLPETYKDPFGLQSYRQEDLVRLCVAQWKATKSYDTEENQNIAQLTILDVNQGNPKLIGRAENLHPTLDRPARYVDPGYWRNKITLLPPSTTQRIDSEESVTQSLEDICRNELLLREPSLLSSASSSLAKKKIEQIAHSATNRHDFESVIQLEEELKEDLNLPPNIDHLLTTRHELAKNSPLNGRSYIAEDGSIKTIQHAIASSSDRSSDNVMNLRSVSKNDNTSICYTGRVETERKALEQAIFIFLKEVKSGCKGLIRNQDGSYELNYVVNSVLSNSSLVAEETGYASKEKAVLDDLYGELITFKDDDDREYRVQIKPVMFSDEFNSLLRLDPLLPASWSSQPFNKEVNSLGDSHLKAIYASKIDNLLSKIKQLNHQISHFEKNLEEATTEIKTIQEKINSIEKAFRAYSDTSKDPSFPEKSLLVRDYLCKMLEIPIVYHCKSSTDRTGILIALSSALSQWIDLKLEMPKNIVDLLSDEGFKEFFAANLMSGHQITRYARSFEGTIDGKKHEDDKLGYKFQYGIFQNPVVQRLLPDRYLREPNLLEKSAYALSSYIILIPVVIGLVCKVLLEIGKNLIHFRSVNISRSLSESQKVIKSVSKIFPEKLINENSPLVGPRHLLHGSSASTDEIKKFEEFLHEQDFDKRTELLKSLKGKSFEYKINSEYCPDKSNRTLASIDLAAPDAAEKLDGIKRDLIKQINREIIGFSEENLGKSRLSINDKFVFKSETTKNNKLYTSSNKYYTTAQQIYNDLHNFFQKIQPQLNKNEREFEVLRVLTTLHQGQMAPISGLALFKIRGDVKDKDSNFLGYKTIRCIWDLSFDETKGLERCQIRLTHVSRLYNQSDLNLLEDPDTVNKENIHPVSSLNCEMEIDLLKPFPSREIRFSIK